MRLALIGGTGCEDWDLTGETLTVETPYGGVALELAPLGDRELLLLSRHDRDHSVPPHRIDHRAHLHALRAAGAQAVLATASCGSLRREWGPGTLVVPDDYIGPFHAATFHDRFDVAPVHIIPGFDDRLRRLLIVAAEAGGHPARSGGVYLQTSGPRLETRAEVRMFKLWADLVGMTLGAEATLAKEAGLPYAALCRVDNLAHGLGTQLTAEASLTSAAETAKAAREVLLTAAERWEPPS